jgi:alkylhydroperoxidase family enzyme
MFLPGNAALGVSGSGLRVGAAMPDADVVTWGCSSVGDGSFGGGSGAGTDDVDVVEPLLETNLSSVTARFFSALRDLLRQI